MGDAAASFEGSGVLTTIATPRAAPASAMAAAVSAATPQVLDAYAGFCGTALHAPPQGAAWVRHWVDAVRPDAVIATLETGGRPALALALEVERAGPFRIARFMGGRHANGNFAPADADWLANVECSHVRTLFEAIGKARPDVDLIALQRLLPEMDGSRNPFATMPGFASPNISLAVDLAGGFDAVLARTSGKRKRKKNRSQRRKFEAAGGFRRIRAGSTEEVRALLDTFFAMKEARFRRMGIANVFSEQPVRDFFRALFAGALDQKEPPFVLHGLEVGGKLRAVTGSSRCGNRLICEFGSISEDELAGASPGDFLFFANIEEACAEGLQVYDFSVGDEPYKRQWCDLETQHRDVLVPLTAKGRALAFMLQKNAQLTSFVKNSPAVWKLTKRLRRRTAGEPSDE
ncbi:GNAT family N-acetyltransferase [Mesorhizobium sp. SP-1A]|uniref:GNAT family N-acetyltransferase n=1 Tax=Mesorhizobium sp. SP-1A TaxID=3077840 RepID=UPI0028F73B8C|nr:GNAT family N-acetyltransferase [Mesorhizobium sp. SP-1A]